MRLCLTDEVAELYVDRIRAISPEIDVVHDTELTAD